MSEQFQPAPAEKVIEAKPVEPPKAAEPTPAAAPESPKADAKPPEPGEPDWLPRRLEQAKSSAAKELLSKFGVDSADALEAQLAELKSLKEAQMSEQEKIAARLAELEPAAQRAASLEASVRAYAERELASLSDTQKAAVTALAGEDPSRVLAAVEALKPTWAQSPAPAPKPADTAPAAGPKDGGTSQVSAVAEFKQYQTSNPFKAADMSQYRLSELIEQQ